MNTVCRIKYFNGNLYSLNFFSLVIQMLDLMLVETKKQKMEPITTTAMISTVVGYLAKNLKDNKSVKGFFTDFTEATVNWIRPLFLTDDGKPKESLKQLQEKPESDARQNAVKSVLEIAIEDNPNAITFLKEMHNKIEEIKGSELAVVNLKAKGHIDIKAKQDTSSANLKDIQSKEGKINIDIDQE